MTKRLLVTAALLASAVSAIAHAQEAASSVLAAPAAGQGASPPAFEVASVKSNKSGEMGARIQRQPGGRVIATNMPLRDLIQFAYQMRPFQLEAVPDWAVSTRYDINAKAAEDIPLTPPGATAPEMLMLRSLLADRFKLVAHTDTKQLPIYALTVLRADGRLGPKLAVATTDCMALAKQAAGRAGSAAAGPPPPPAVGDRVQCGLRIAPGRLSAGGFPMSELANGLSALVQRPVIDRTGLTGTYDAEMTFSMEAIAGPPGLAGAPPPSDPNLPSLFTAVQEQLGLKLESTRGPVQMLVIDRVEPPIED